MQRYATALSDIVTDANILARQSVEATDGTGAIRVVLGTDGLPDTIEADPDWHRDLDPDEVGAAVAEAVQAATARRLAAWAESLDQNDLEGRLDRLGDVGTEPVADPAGPVADPAGPWPPAAPPGAAPDRPLGDLAEDMLGELGRALESTDLSPPPPATCTGADRSGQVTVTLADTGFVSCTVDGHWAGEQSGDDLNAAFGQALDAARARLAAAAEQPAADTPLDDLLAEALRLLSRPERLADS